MTRPSRPTSSGPQRWSPTRVVLGLLAALALTLTACGEPPLAIDLPARDGHVTDLAGILDAEAIEAALADYAADGVDIVVLTYTTEGANCGEAFRAGREVVAAWDADVAMVAVAEPDGFADVDAERCAGVQPRDDFALGRGTREEITEVLWPPLIEDNAWSEVVAVGAEELFAALATAEEAQR